MLTTPVPPGVSSRSAFVLVEIILSLKDRLSTVTGAAKEVAPDTVNASNVVVPADRFPVVLIFSLPKLIAPEESVIDPSVNVKFPITESSPAASVPVVVKFSFPKLIAPEESVIDPLAIVKVPKVVPVAKVCAPLKVKPSATVKSPSTIKFSFMLTEEESSELIVVPPNPSPAIVTRPDPFAVILRSSLLLRTSMLLSLNLMPGNSTVPVPLGCTMMSALDNLAVMLLPRNLMSDLTGVRSKKSPKLLLILLPASYSESPLPLSALVPTSITCCAISTNI